MILCRFSIALVFILATVSPVFAELRAIVMGINAYAAAQELRGAVNDARLIARSLKQVGVSDLNLLLDETATLANFDRVWADTVARSRRGDILLFSFSGHGIRVPERDRRAAANGFQKGFLLQPHDEETAPQEILTDEALYDRFAAATDEGIKVVFVADACYAGAATRGLDTRSAVGVSRFQRFSTAAGPLSALAGSNVAARPPNPDVSVFSATVEQRAIQEIVVGDAYHGALSVAFAEGITRAGREGAAHITLGMLKDYVSPQVVLLSNKRQIPQFIVPEPDLELFPRTVVTGQELDELPPVSLTFVGTTPSHELSGAVPSNSGVASELLFEQASGELIDASGDVLATGLSLDELPAAIAARRVVKALGGIASRQALQVGAVVSSTSNLRGDRFFLAGTTARFRVEADDYPYASVIDLTGAGDVQLIWPLAALGDPEDGSVTGTIEINAPVTGPFGADYVITVLSKKPLLEFNRGLAARHNTGAPTALYEMVEAVRAEGAVIGLDLLFSCRRLGSSGECVLADD